MANEGGYAAHDKQLEMNHIACSNEDTLSAHNYADDMEMLTLLHLFLMHNPPTLSYLTSCNIQPLRITAAFNCIL